MTKTDSYLYLHELTNEQIQAVMSLSQKDYLAYIHILISRFYPTIEPSSEEYKKLVGAYRSSFLLESIYRNSDLLISNMTAIYTKTGLLRELSLDMYSLDVNKLQIH